MKKSRWIFALLMGLTALTYHPAEAAISQPNQSRVLLKQQHADTGQNTSRQHSFRHKFKELKSKFKQKIKRWWAMVEMAFPTGKLLSSLIFLLLSIIFFAIGGLTVIGGVFNVLGSVSVILALVLFVLWISERAKSASQPAN